MPLRLQIGHGFSERTGAGRLTAPNGCRSVPSDAEMEKTQQTSSEMLLRLFCRHYDNPANALLRFESNLSRLRLSFDFYTQLRELRHPSTPEVPEPPESLIYYYIPNSGWGTDRALPSDPADPNFVYHADGIGLNMGCPIRLARALDILEQLPEADRGEIRSGIAAPTKHLPTIEEILWLSGWRSASGYRRGGAIPGASGDVDWSFTAKDVPIYLEAKFRPSGWPHLSDRGAFKFIEGTLLKSSARKFPEHAIASALQIVGMTGLPNLNKDLVHQFGRELQTYPQIHAIVYRSLGQMTHVLSLSEAVVSQVLDSLEEPSVRNYPTNYIVIWHIEQRDQRLEKHALSPVAKLESSVICKGLRPRFNTKVIAPPEGAYRNRIKSRGADGEPLLEIIPRLLWKEGFGPKAKPA